MIYLNTDKRGTVTAAGHSSRPDADPITVLPLIEAAPETPEASWLEALERHVQRSLKPLLSLEVLILPIVHSVPWPPKIVDTVSPLVVVPWGAAESERLSGRTVFEAIGAKQSREIELQTFSRPQSTATEIFPLSMLGGWSGGSHANLPGLVPACPGWDTVGTVYQRLYILRRPDQAPSHEMQPRFAHHVAHVRQGLRGDSPDADTGYFIYYLARALALTLHHIANLGSIPVLAEQSA